MLESQRAVCAKYKTECLPCDLQDKVGIAENVKSDALPLNGVRIAPGTGETTGWYIWRGDWSDDPDFFIPVHAQHLLEFCPEAVPYLALPAGWRFQLAPNHEDVWFDPEVRQ
jgi:hypothetical protein